MDGLPVIYDEKGLLADDAVISQWLGVVQADTDRSRQARRIGEYGVELGFTRAVHDSGRKEYTT